MFIRLNIVLFLTALGLCVCYCAIIENGVCNTNVPGVLNFNIEEFKGIWYEIARTENQLEHGDCSHKQFELYDTTSYVYDVYNYVVNENFLELNNGTAISSEEEPAKFVLSMPHFDRDIDYWIVHTIYSLYALVYSCENVGTERHMNFWILGREEQFINEEVVYSVIDTWTNNTFGFEVTNFVNHIDHSDDACYILPVLDENEPVVLPGQCEDIAVVENFDINAFAGLWHNIESYVSGDDDGTCKNQMFNLDASNDITVIHTWIVDLALHDNTYPVQRIGNDGKFSFTDITETGAVEREVWILATDYDNYALTYSCENIGNASKRIYSQKMSKSKHLSIESDEQLNQLINTIIVLNQLYYRQMDQSDDGCFYYPEHVQDKPVIFPGQCDMYINGVADLDLNRFSDLWHEIEGYPSINQQGTCNNALYSSTNNTAIDFIITQVIDETLIETSGIGVQNENGVFTTEINGRYFNTWVLATDYDSYALIYVCDNLNEEQREVWSWKLSRSKQLTFDASAAINETIDSIPVLDQRYYQTKDQSREGCFFFPTPVAGKPVEFPGQCDENIPTVANLEMDRFSDTWRVIEAYPSIQQPGECTNLHLTNTSINSFFVETDEVSDQFLVAGNGTMDFTGSTDNAKFTMNININGENINITYWILGTDYINYALAYSCININDDWRAIWSWKLSRDTSLNAAANTAINEIISDIDVLDNVYYEPIAHTDEACFYLPELEHGEPIIIIGQCDENIPVVEDFNAENYNGLWHLISSYYSDHRMGKCNDVTYSIEGGDLIEIINTHVNDTVLVTETGTATHATAISGTAKFIVSLPGRADKEYWILDTDYESYSILYSCETIGEYRRVWSWKLSRTRELTTDAEEAINSVVDSVNVLNNRYYEMVDNTDESCFYYPEHIVDQPVVFRGQCDVDIPVMSNFDFDNFAGLWHEIESYPTDFQDGTCNNVFYNNYTSSFLNTQVMNQTLHKMNGVVERSPDESARFNVTYTIPETNETISYNYWVLATDYENFALVYSCENDINSNHRNVWSWKLGREKQLSPEANTAIDNVINNVQVLDERYYQSRDQSRNGCFYYPEPVPGEPVVFPGHCDETISVSDDFITDQFEGAWREIAAYPSIQQNGDCTDFEFTATSNNSFDIYTTEVFNQRLLEVGGTVTYESNAKYTIRINFGGNSFTLPFWILATDYENYALAYSCINLNSDYRAIWSWKMSRNNTLSDEAIAAIDEAMSNTDVLRERYYETTQQSDDACFYLPVLGWYDPVTFRGVCDETIGVVQNFDPDKYAGLWHDIESYYAEYQNGVCQDSTYNALPDGSIEVYSTQVVDETLETLRATAFTTDGSGKLVINFQVNDTEVSLPYWILSTDYESYALVYSCVNSSSRRRVFSWKLSRNKELSNEARTIIDEIVDSIPVLSDEYYTVRNQSSEGCFYYPDPVPGQPVTFRGQCDELPVVTDFDLLQYNDIWYDIASYPNDFQVGTCPSAEYTLIGDDEFEVVNTQVVEEELDSAYGFGRLASNDTSAKLIIAFPTSDNEVRDLDYWVLATDYNNYALVYSCENIDPDRRRVSSWKLSRDKVLSTESENAINSVINSVRELNEMYYEPQGHTERDCFYYPDNNGGPVYLDGQCDDDDDVTVVTEFDAERFSRKWYELARFPSELQEGECANAEISLIDSIGNISLTFTHEERLNTVIGQIVASDDKGVLTATFPRTGSEDLFVLKLFVLDTDYEEFALLYSCRNINSTTKQVYSWKLSKDSNDLSDDANYRIDNLVRNKTDLFQGYYKYTDHSNYGCFYYPILNNPDVITLPGPCNDTITAKANFNIDAYQGTWFEVSRYPNPTQIGQCARSVYSRITENTLSLLSTIVSNEELNAADGAAVVASDGNGLLHITIDIDGVEYISSVYVLETNYDNFALLYSCVDIPDQNERRVTSWLLSRNRTLDSQFNGVIDSVIKQTQGLLEEYYEYSEQTDDACFYIPEVNDDIAVIFRGQCNESVAVYEDFDIERYVGWWHEIERYPTGSDSGSCISSQVFENNGQYTFVDTNVFGLAATVTVGDIIISSNYPGRLRKRVQNGNEAREIDFWILDTDYETYSLLYACENINDDYRQVWSAKHSKTRNLTPAAQAAMEPIIAANPVLYSQFYKTVDQGDSSCFHYPEQSGEFIVLPGQCDESIPVVQDFDMSRFASVWYQIERYPQINEQGYCTGHRYSPRSGEDVIDVVNWEVIGDELIRVQGTAVLSNDGTGRMTVTMPIVETNQTESTEFYILDTDYASYSVLYNCRNLNQFQRYVGAWKLSRTRTLPAAAEQAINNLISLRDELHQPYFLTIEQNEDCPNSAFSLRSTVPLLAFIVALMLMILN